MRYFVFVDTPYYPYVDDEIEADSPEAARAAVAATLRPGDDTTVYVVPADAVMAVRCEGPKRAPDGLLKLLQDQNRWRSAVLENQFYDVRVEAGSLRPPGPVTRSPG